MLGRADPPPSPRFPPPGSPERPERSRSRGQRTHSWPPPPRGREARLTHGIRQGHVAGPLLSQGLMHGESCPVAPAPEAASGAPGSGRPAEHPTPRLPLPVPPERELRRDCLGCKLQPKCLLPLPSPLLPPSSPASLCSGRQQHWRSEQRRALAQDPSPPSPSAPSILVIHLPASQARQGAVLAPWGRDCVEKEGEATAWGRVAFSVLWREGLGLASCSRIYNWGGGRVRGSELRTHTHTHTHAHLCRFGLSASRMT